ncbi:hypothetical protein [Croceicoccus naphthovorans]|uniref:Uncharacterized protein n=1 Tax=Croceicoccus naphthovorans TaxID=1348774 RepID=A0A0G3XHF5_9SPHN|nr:hypothetical protein [Croceicoccus naphthovorans]AKM10622.1 hypothetical protein AB433_12670 [Croceicoccus naphthovorans]MBB3988848.1 hypothetical protein [Croceicoccus naphthovorans]
MGQPFTLRTAAATIVAAGSLLVSGCLLTPGKFTSELVLKKGGEFAFTYDGEISMMGLTQLASMGANEAFEAECYDDDFEATACTAEEVAEQRAEWEAEQAKDAEKKKQFVRMMGNVDPGDPESVAKLVEVMRRQDGWEKVEQTGDGVFTVSYSATGSLSHPFMFPVVEKLTVSPFLVAVPRADGSVRVEAEGFGSETMPSMGPGMGMLAAMGAMKDKGDKPEPILPDGTFTIVTDGRILANNTDEGPSDVGGMQRLKWTVDTSTKVPPMALIALD